MSSLSLVGRCLKSRLVTGPIRTNQWLLIPSRYRHCFSVMFDSHGPPGQVLYGKELALPDKLQKGEVLVKMTASPIHPADVNLIEGTYAVLKPLPAIGGNEGVGVVEETGEGVTLVQPGDHVIPAMTLGGTWCTHSVFPESSLLKIDPRLPLLTAATMVVNPGTAYRMLRDFGVKAGDTVIQSGANSGVGQALVQIAKTMGIRTVNVVRDREDLSSVVNYLKSLGADYVVTEEELRKPESKKLWDEIPRPLLAVDCVAGRTATELIRHLARYGTLVNYGGMSRKPVTVTVSALIFKEIQIRGFWFSEWRNRSSKAAMQELVDAIGEMVLRGELKGPLSEETPLRRFAEAVSKSTQPFLNRKQILVMDGE